MFMGKAIKLNGAIEKRLKANSGHQPRRGRCIICGKDWMECPHDRGQTNLLEQAYELKKVLGL
jgi:hypothetical protein